MNEDAKARYSEIVKIHPEWFRSAPTDPYLLLLDQESVAIAESAARVELQERGLDPNWATVGVVYEDLHVVVLRDAVRRPDGTLGTYIRIMHQGRDGAGVVIMPTLKGRIILLRHFRHAARSHLLEFPRGFADQDDFETAARRELNEEMGAQPTRLTPLGEVFPDAGLMGSRVRLFLAEIDAVGKADSAEGIRRIEQHDVAIVKRMIADGTIQDGFTIATFARAEFKGML
jgi:ADP-ribose pyrophosphatase